MQEIKRRTKTGCLTCRKRRIKASCIPLNQPLPLPRRTPYPLYFAASPPPRRIADIWPVQEKSLHNPAAAALSHLSATCSYGWSLGLTSRPSPSTSNPSLIDSAATKPKRLGPCIAAAMHGMMAGRTMHRKSRHRPQTAQSRNRCTVVDMQCWRGASPQGSSVSKWGAATTLGELPTTTDCAALRALHWPNKLAAHPPVAFDAPPHHTTTTTLSPLPSLTQIHRPTSANATSFTLLTRAAIGLLLE